jgi:8-oxo-dGTP diphosphatase
MALRERYKIQPRLQTYHKLVRFSHNGIMKRKGTSIIFVNDKRQILLFLRDDKPGLPYRNMWDIPGGHVEDEETPEQCIVREMKEEMDLTLEQFELFSVREFDDRIEYTFWKKANLNIEKRALKNWQDYRFYKFYKFFRKNEVMIPVILLKI